MNGTQKEKEEWGELEDYIAKELEKVRKRTLLADSFDEMEDVVVEMGQRLQQAILAAAVEHRQLKGRQKCPECGAEMDNKGMKPRQMKTSIGKVRFERRRWSCPECEVSLFPPGRKTED